MRLFTRYALLAIVVALLTPNVAGAQASDRCFPETGYCIAGRIRAFWEQNGGLPVFGFPVGPQYADIVEGKQLQLQWFERNRLELHPENAPPYDVLLGRLGVDRLAQQGRPDWQNFPVDERQGDCVTFAETGHSACGAILRAWRASGLEFDGKRGHGYAESLALFGLPVSSPLREVIEGRVFTVQWFERARFELHPENARPYDVLLGLLGNEIRADGQRIRVSASAEIDGLTAAGARLFFSARTPETGLELWASDGTEAGTHLVRDIWPGPGSAWPRSLVALNDRVLFAARGPGAESDSLWVSDGTAEGTAELLPASQLFDPWQLTRVGDRVFFVASDATHGSELWATDGSPQGTRLVKDVYPGARGSTPEQNMPMGYRPYGLTRVGDQLFFHAEAPGLGYAIWKSDGTEAGTQFVTNLDAGASSPEYWDMADFNGSLLFVARTSRLGYGLYRTMGAAASTALVHDFSYGQDTGSLRLYPPVSGLEVIGGAAYMSYSGNLWSSDGTEADTDRRTGLLTGDIEGLRGNAFFLSLSRPFGQDLAQPGDSLGANVVTVVAPTLYLGHGRMYDAGDRLFIGISGKGRAELWASDGSAAGTSPVAAWPGRVFGQRALSDGERPAAVLNGRLFFVADDGIYGGELWVSDGTPGGTALVKDINLERVDPTAP